MQNLQARVDNDEIFKRKKLSDYEIAKRISGDETAKKIIIALTWYDTFLLLHDQKWWQWPTFDRDPLIKEMTLSYKKLKKSVLTATRPAIIDVFKEFGKQVEVYYGRDMVGYRDI